MKYRITFASRRNARKQFPAQFVAGVLSKPAGITAKLTHKESEAQPFKKKPNRLVQWLNVWLQCKYPASTVKFRAERI